MRLTTGTAIVAAAVIVLASWPADAQTRKRSRASVERQTVTRMVPARSATRITVRKARSYLDPGTEVLPYSQQYTDYAIPPMGSPYDIADPTRSYRFPLPDNFELPGYARYW